MIQIRDLTDKKSCIYIIGELATYLVNNTTLNCKNETLSVNENDILNLLKEVGIRHNNLGNETVIEYLLNALVKLLIKFKDKKSEIESMIKHYKRSFSSPYLLITDLIFCNLSSNKNSLSVISSSCICNQTYQQYFHIFPRFNLEL